MLKQITLAALAATFIAGSAAVANAESNVSGSDPASSAGLQQDWTATHGTTAFSMGPPESRNAYGYAPARRVHRLHRSATTMKTTTTKHKYE
jgi:hypothetical protein